MKLLILGGTIFVGRHLVEAALARGHAVTLFNRGRHHAELYPEAEKLRGDRDGGLDALRGRRWDAAIDTCGYVPRVVSQSAALLADVVGHYTFVSSISVYSDVSRPGIDENSPAGRLTDEKTEEVTGETYGPLKVLCEQAAERALPGRVLTVRPGLIVGPCDPTDRFTYWPHRVAQGGDVLAPDRPELLTQFIDARDLATWTVRMVEAGKTGIYNAVGPDYPLTMGRVLDECKAVSASDANFVWADEAFLLEQDVAPWTDLPLWIPGSAPEYAGMSQVSCGKAISHGLTFRPLAETVRDTLAWDAARPADRTWHAGLSREREAGLLQAWRERA